MNYYDSKDMLEKRLNSVIGYAMQKLKETGLNDADIDNAVHGRMDAIEIATDDDTPTPEYLFVSLVMDCKELHKRLKNGEAETVAGYVKAAETQCEELSKLPLTVTGWRLKNNRPKGGNNRTGYEGAFKKTLRQMNKEIPAAPFSGFLGEFQEDADGKTDAILHDLRMEERAFIKVTRIENQTIYYDEISRNKPDKRKSVTFGRAETALSEVRNSK